MTKVVAKTRCHQVGYVLSLLPPCANGPPRRLPYLLPTRLARRSIEGHRLVLLGMHLVPRIRILLSWAFVCPIAVPCVLIDPKALFLTNWHFIVPSSGYIAMYVSFTSAANRFRNYPRHGPNQTYIHTYTHRHVDVDRTLRVGPSSNV